MDLNNAATPSKSRGSNEEKESSKLNKVLSVLKLKSTTNLAKPGPYTKFQKGNIKLDKELKVSLVAIKTSPKSLLNKCTHSDNHIYKSMITRNNYEKLPKKTNAECAANMVGVKPIKPSKSIGINENIDSVNSKNVKQSEGPVLNNSNEKSMVADTNLPAKVGLFEISIPNSISSSGNSPMSAGSLSDEQLGQMEVCKSSDLTLNSQKEKLQRVGKKLVIAGVPPRPLSPKIIITNLSKVSDPLIPGVNKRKQRTPVKANIANVETSDNNCEKNVEKLSFIHKNKENSISDSKLMPISNNSENLKHLSTNHVSSNNDSPLLSEVFLKATTVKEKKNLNPSKFQKKMLQQHPNSLTTIENCNLSGNKHSSVIIDTNKPSSPNQELSARNIQNLASLSRTPKRKLQQTSTTIGLLESSSPKRQKKNRVKFLHDSNDEIEKKELESCLASPVDNNKPKDILDKTMLQLLQSRNVQVTFQKPKSVSPAKVTAAKKKPLSSEIKKRSPRKIKDRPTDKVKGLDNENKISFDIESEKISNSELKIISTESLNLSSTPVSSLSLSEDDLHSPINKGEKAVNKIAPVIIGKVTSGSAIKGILKKAKTDIQKRSPKKKNIDKKGGLDNENNISFANENEINLNKEQSTGIISIESQNQSYTSISNLSLSEEDVDSPENLEKKQTHKIARMKTGKLASDNAIKGILKKPRTDLHKLSPRKFKNIDKKRGLDSENKIFGCDQKIISPESLNQSSNVNLNLSLSAKDTHSPQNLEKKQVYKIAKMKTGKVASVNAVKGILKKSKGEILSVAKKANQISDSTKLDESVNAKEDNRPVQDNKVLNSSPKKCSSKKLKLTEDKENESASILKKGTRVQKKLQKKPSVRTVKVKSSIRPKKLPKNKKINSQDHDLSLSIDNAGSLDESLSESDDNMPLIDFQSTSPAIKTGSSKVKISQMNSAEELKPIDGFVEHLKKESKRRRGRGRRRQKFGKQKGGKVKDELETESSFFEDDEDEEGRITKASSLPNAVRRTNQKRTGRRYSVTGNWYIATGYLNDILSLLEDFENCDGWRFKDFSRCWQKKSFSLVYRGRQTFKELLEFSEEIALLTMRFIGPSHATKRRIGALYTLYGLYYKFPVGHFFSLRFELQEYKNLLELVQPFRSMVDNPDPAYIFRKLELRGAILHCATAYEPCYDFHNEERDLVDLEYGKQKLAKSSAVNIAIPKIQIEADSDMLSLYHSTKAKLTGTGKEPDPERALSLISSTFLKTISSELVEMRKGTLLELGMAPKILSGFAALSDVQEENSVNGNTQISSANSSEASEIQRNSQLDLYLHSVEGDILDTINKSGRAQKSLTESENNMMLKDKSIQDFMKPPVIDLSKPLELVQNKKNKALADDFNFSLNLNDIKLPSSSTGGSSMPVRVNLKASDTGKEDDEALIPLPLPRRKKRGAKRNAILIHAAKPRARVTKATTYNPCFPKSLSDDEDKKDSISSIKQPVISSTSLPTADIPILSDKAEKVSTIDVNVKLASGITLKTVKVKLKITSKKLAEIQKDPKRLNTLKKNIDPLVKNSLIGPDRNKLWLIQDIELCNNVNGKISANKSPVKPICFKNRFECLKEESSESDSDSSSDESLTLNMPKKISKSKIDDDYVPVSDEDEGDKILLQEFEKERFYESEMSSPDEDYCYFPRKRGRRSQYITTIERGPLDSDRLILPKSETASVKMVPINVGGKIRYFPASNNMIKKEEVRDDKNGESEGETSNKENMDNLNTWNDYSSPSGPPLCKRRFSRSGHKDISKQFSYLYPRNPIIGRKLPPALPEVVIEKKKRGRGRPKKSISVEQHEMKFKEYFDRVTRRVRTNTNNDSSLNSSVSDHEENEETGPQFIGPDTWERQSDESHTVSVNFTDESNANRNTRLTNSNRDLREKSNPSAPYTEVAPSFNEIVPKSEINVPQQTIKKEFPSTVDELVEDWDDDYQIIDHQTATNTNQMCNPNDSDWNKSLAKQEPLDSAEELSNSTPPGSPADMDYHSDSESGHHITEDTLLNTQTLASNSVTMTDSYSGLSEILQPTSLTHEDHEDILHNHGVSQDPILIDGLESSQSYEEAVNNLEEPNMSNATITTDDLKNALYCKIKTQDGKDLFVPFTMIPQMKSDGGIEILEFDAAELKLCTSPQKISSPTHLENSLSTVPLEMANYASSSFHSATEPYSGSSQISVQTSSHMPISSTPVNGTYGDEYIHSKSFASEPSYSNWEPAVNFIDLANVSTSPLKTLIPSLMPIQSTASSAANPSPRTSQNFPSSRVSQVPKVSSPMPIQSTSFSAVTPSTKASANFSSSKISQMATNQKCNFFFSPKLKSLTNKQTASGRPPSPVIVKPLVKFVFKGKSWMNKNRKF